MRQRCLNPKNQDFALYGGRGITICERWSSFENFLADMGEPPAGSCLERIDNDAGYSPKNCRWASQSEQARNRRGNHILTVRGVTGCLSALCEQFGVNQRMVWARLNLGWPPELAFFGPKYQKLKKLIAESSTL
jgi:hypothetical protein